tara:strand:+ start:58 stop:1017 length:960 start_codon:yes stop_codon:yes gene_type:complete
MFKIKYDTPSLQIIYFGPQKFEGEYFISDLDSNLCAIRGWFTLPKTHSNITIKLNPDIIDKLTLGIKITLREKNKEVVYSKDFYLKDEIPQNYFFSPYDEMSWGSWDSIMYGDEYKNMFEIFEDDIVYDLGANVGAFSKWVDLKYPYTQIYGFEPTPGYLDCLNNTFSNKEQIQFFSKAISNKEEIKHFNIFKDGVTNSLIPNLNNHNAENYKGKVEIECVNLEEFINKNNLFQPTFIKMDIEGAEYDVIDSLSDEFILNTRILLLEFHNFHYKEGLKVERLYNIIGRLISLGFGFDIKRGDSLNDPSGTIIFKKIKSK